MVESNYLTNLIELDTWKKWQSIVSEVTGLAIVMVDYKGEPVTEHDGICDFCKMIRQDPEMGKYCKKCDVTGSLESIMTGKPCAYKCHFSIIDVAIPIIKGGIYLGAIMAGQVRADERSNKYKSLLVSKDVDFEEKRKSLQKYYDRIPVLSEKQIDNSIDLICRFGESFLQKEMKSTLSEESETAHRVGDSIPNTQKAGNRIISDALDFIYSSCTYKISLSDVANHCYVSIPYLSKLFMKEMGENFSSFMNRIKVERARQMLIGTNMTVNEISDYLGFNETGYFIKIFKKQMNQTPLKYREQHARESFLVKL